MRTRLIVGPLLALFALAGCTTSHSPTASAMLASAHASLERNDTDSARQYLDGAGARLDTARDRKEYALLTAEVQLRTGDAVAAERAMTSLLSSYPHDPRVQEMAGKSALLTGDFTSAVYHFDKAMNGYAAQADIDRAADLLALARGFDAYAGGRIAAAEEHWAGIRDAGLRAGVLHSSAAMSPQQSATELARIH